MKYLPKNAGMSAREIARWWNEEIACNNEIADDIEGEEDAPKRIDVKIVASKIPAKLAQEFVDKEYDLREEYIDMAEEDLVDARMELIFKLVKKYTKTVVFDSGNR